MSLCSDYKLPDSPFRECESVKTDSIATLYLDSDGVTEIARVYKYSGLSYHIDTYNNPKYTAIIDELIKKHNRFKR